MPGVLSTFGAATSLVIGGGMYFAFMAPHILVDNLWTFVRKISTTGMKESADKFAKELSEVLGTDLPQTRTAMENLFQSYGTRGWRSYVTHNVLVVPWLLFPLQFVGPLRRNYPKLHRVLGTALVFSIIPAAVSGAELGFHSIYGMNAFIPGCLLAAGSLFYVGTGYKAAKKKDWMTHQLRMTQLTLFLSSIPLSRMSTAITWKLSTYLPANEDAPVWVLMDQNVTTGLWLALGGGYMWATWYQNRWRAKFGDGKSTPRIEEVVENKDAVVVETLDSANELPSTSTLVDVVDEQVPEEPAPPYEADSGEASLDVPESETGDSLNEEAVEEMEPLGKTPEEPSSKP